MKVFWTQTALNNLEDIFDYYKNRTSAAIARKLVKKIVAVTINIQKSPNIGKIEILLKDRRFEYRFLVIDNYKVIYWVEDSYIKIAAVFDSRQNPVKINRLNI